MYSLEFVWKHDEFCNAYLYLFIPLRCDCNRRNRIALYLSLDLVNHDVLRHLSNMAVAFKQVFDDLGIPSII